MVNMAEPGGGAVAKDMGAALPRIGESMDAFASQAASGLVAVNETGGQALLRAIKEMRQWIDGVGMDMQWLEQAPKLGGSGGAQTISPYAQQVATDAKGFIPVLKQFANSLNKAEEGIRTAMANYQNVEHANSSTFKHA